MPLRDSKREYSREIHTSISSNLTGRTDTKELNIVFGDFIELKKEFKIWLIRKEMNCWSISKPSSVRWNACATLISFSKLAYKTWEMHTLPLKCVFDKYRNQPVNRQFALVGPMTLSCFCREYFPTLNPVLLFSLDKVQCLPDWPALCG